MRCEIVALMNGVDSTGGCLSDDREHIAAQTASPEVTPV